MFSAIARRINTAFAIAALSISCLAAQAQTNNPSVVASLNGGPNKTITVSVTTTVTGGAKVNGTLHVQTNAGVIDANYSSLTAWTTSKGVSYATGTALGYYQPNSGGSLVATTVSVVFCNAPGTKGTVTVTMSNYYSHAVYFQSGTCNVMQGHLTVTPAQ